MSGSIHVFNHNAMATQFQVRIAGEEKTYAAQTAQAAFALADELESRLSRFIEGSEVAQINAMRAGETLYLSESCHQCLLLALRACASTGGLFDITLGSRIAHRKSGASGPAPPLTGKLTLHPDVPAITCESPGREIDLGGIAKGFALDQLKHLLTEWDADDALLAAGASSLLAFGPNAWPVDLTGDREAARVFLTNQALGASGTGMQGNHIIHPAGPEAMPARTPTRVWVIAPTAALAEIWSTTLMLVTPEEIPDCLSGHADIAAVYAEHDGHVQSIPSSTTP